MRTRTLLTPALVASLALVSSPVLAEDHTGGSTDDVTTAECPAPAAIVGSTLEQAAEAAAAAAERLAEGDTCLSDESELAEDALQAALERLSADNDGVAADVLQALIAGESPATIGAAHGAAVSEAAKARRPEQAGAAEASDVRATPAVPAEPATPEAPATPAVPAEPATPEIPETPVETPVIPDTPPVPAPPADVGDAAPPEIPGPVTPGQP